MASNHRLKALLFIFGLCISTSATPADTDQKTIERMGLSPERLQKIDEFVSRDIAAGKMAGAVTLVARHGEVVHFSAAGDLGTNDSRPMTTDTLFRIYSMTKPVTTVAAMMLYEGGAFHLGDPVHNYLPEFADIKILRDGQLVAPGTPITIQQLMTHTAGLTYGWHPTDPVDQAYRDADLINSTSSADFIARLTALPLRFEPGTRYHYSVATDVLGVLVERISGMTLEAFFQTRIFAPLGMEDTFFNVPEDKLERLALNHVWNGEANSIVPIPAESAQPVTGVTVFSGGGGLISTARDYWVFCEMLRRGGSYEGTRILGPKTLQFMTQDHLTAAVRDRGAAENPDSHLYAGQSFGLGFGVITNPAQTGVISSKGAYSWGGAANTKFWIDPQEDFIAILMTQVMAAPYGDRLRFDMKVATYQALTGLGPPP
ncbi:MAG: beta-lactamase family protein [Luminiphilus sp.]|nr:beta-lactamase family protein [Luminiphilus sp.]